MSRWGPWPGSILCMLLSTVAFAQPDDPPDASGCSEPMETFGGPGTTPATLEDAIDIAADIEFEDAKIFVDVDDLLPVDLTVAITGPDGAEVILHDRNEDFTDLGLRVTYWDFGIEYEAPLQCGCYMKPPDADGLSLLNGSSTLGEWTLACTDNVTDPEIPWGTLVEWCIEFFEEGPGSGVESLTCDEVAGSAEFAWTNPEDFIDINIYWGGDLVDTIPGSDTSYTLSLSDETGRQEFFVEGTFAATRSRPQYCAVEVAAPPPVVCILGPGNSAEVTWENPAIYDEIQILVEGDIVVTLDGEESNYTTDSLSEFANTSVEICVDGLLDSLPTRIGCCSLSVIEPADLEYCGEPGNVFSANDLDTLFVEVEEEFGVRRLDVFVDVSFELARLDLLKVEVNSPSGTTVQLTKGSYDFDLPEEGPVIVHFSDVGAEFGSAPFDCGCFMRPAGPGALGNFYGEPADGDWTLDLGAARAFFNFPYELNEYCLRFFECGPEIPTAVTCEIVGGDVVVNWPTMVGVDEIEVYRENLLIQTLDGSATEYTDFFAPFGVFGYTVVGRSADAVCTDVPKGSSCRVERLVEVCSTPETLLGPGNWSTSDEVAIVEDLYVDSVRVSFDLSMTERAFVEVGLTSPAGTRLLFENHELEGEVSLTYAEDGEDPRDLWPNLFPDLGEVKHPARVHMDVFRGEPAEGDWSLDVRVRAENGVTTEVTLEDWCLQIVQGCNVEPARDLTCGFSDDGVELEWINEDRYDRIEILENNLVIAGIDGDATSYQHLEAIPGRHTYVVRGIVFGRYCGNPSEGCILDIARNEACSSADTVVDPDDSSSDSIEVVDDSIVEQIEVLVDVSFDNEFVSYWEIELESPEGTVASLLAHDSNRSDGVRLTFSDRAPDRASRDSSHDRDWPLCECRLRPHRDDLDVFRGVPADGEWTLTVTSRLETVDGRRDNDPSDGGVLNEWCLVWFANCALEPPEDLAAVITDEAVELEWTQPVAYDEVHVIRDGGELAVIDDGSSTYSDLSMQTGSHRYWLVAWNESCGVRSNSVVVRTGAVDSCNDEEVSTGSIYTSTIPINEDLTVDSVEVFVDFFGSPGGGNGGGGVTLTSPAGTEVQLVSFHGFSDWTIATTFADWGRPFDLRLADQSLVMRPESPGHLSDLTGEQVFEDEEWTMTVDHHDSDSVLREWCVSVAARAQPRFLRGDVDGDSIFFGLIDTRALLVYFFGDGNPPPCLDAADFNDSGSVDGLVDALAILVHTFVADSPEPPAPGPVDCGVDPTDDEVSCVVEPYACN